jgi:hypothetical protein
MLSFKFQYRIIIIIDYWYFDIEISNFYDFQLNFILVTVIYLRLKVLFFYC